MKLERVRSAIGRAIYAVRWPQRSFARFVSWQSEIPDATRLAYLGIILVGVALWPFSPALTIGVVGAGFMLFGATAAWGFTLAQPLPATAFVLAIAGIVIVLVIR